MCSCSSFIKLSSQHFKNRHGSFIMPHQFSSSIRAGDLKMFCTPSFGQSLGRVHKHEVLLMSAFNPEPKTTSRLHAKVQDHEVILAGEGEDQLTHPHSSPPMMAAPPTFSSLTSSQADMATMEAQNYSPSEMVARIQPSTIQLRDERALRRKTHQLTYLLAAVASSFGITSLAAASVYYRFSWQMEGGEVPWTEMLGTFSLALGAAVGMEYWARWAHRALWHHSLWHMHESHHRAREGPFELNDIFAIINAVPAIALMAFGFLHKGLVPGLCFGAGLGITIFGIAYMFVHDGLVHRRFPVGPIADVPYFQRVAGAHQLHHADTFNGVPYGLFLGPKELEEVGGRTELEKVLQKRKRERTNPING